MQYGYQGAGGSLSAIGGIIQPKQQREMLFLRSAKDHTLVYQFPHIKASFKKGKGSKHGVPVCLFRRVGGYFLLLLIRIWGYSLGKILLSHQVSIRSGPIDKSIKADQHMPDKYSDTNRVCEFVYFFFAM